MTHPPPLVRARPATAAETPRTATALMACGKAAGWDCWATYAQGTAIDARGNAKAVVESLVVRMSRPPCALVGTWTDGKFTSGWACRLGETAIRVGARDLSALAREEDGAT